MKTVDAHDGKNRHRFHWGYRHLAALAVFAIVLVAVGLQFSLRRARNTAIAEIQTRLEAQVVFRTGMVQDGEAQIRRKAQFLAALPEVHELMGSVRHPEGKPSTESLRRRVSGIFLGFANSNPEIARLRLVLTTDSGLELVRVEHQNGGMVVVPSSRLDRIGRREFFCGALALRPGDVYLSDLSLFWENGKVAVPHMPAMRASAPLFDERGGLIGLVIVSIDATTLLANFHKTVLAPFRVYLTNEHGDFLAHPSRDREFGMDLGAPRRWESEFDGILPLSPEPRWIRGAAAPHDRFLAASRKVPLDSSGRGFTIVATYPDSALNAGVVRQRNVTLGVAAGILALGGILFLLYLRLQRRVQKRILDLNEDLERQVRERTAEIQSYSALQRTILATAGLAVIASDEQGIITLFNPAAEDMLGYTSEEAVGKMTPAQFRFAEEVDALAAEYSRQTGAPLETGFQALVSESRREGAKSRERTYVRKDGTRLPVLLTITSLKNEHGEFFGYLAMVVDLTERRKIEEALRVRTEEAEAASRSKADFLANMSHEIRTPLSAVLGLAQVLEGRVADAEAIGLVRRIRRAGGSLQRLIDDVLDYSKIEAGHLELENAPFRMDDILDNLGTIMGANAGSKNLELVIGAPPSGTTHLIGDSHRLEQVLINLTGNAIKFTDKGSVSVGMDLLSLSDDLATLRFSVRDSGIGISPENQARIFDSFSQADTSTTRRFGGTGLGLAISRLLVEKMGGSIEVRSEAGKGCEFRFTAVLRTVRPEATETGSMTGLEVLVADDQELSRDAIVAVAASIGWQTVAVDSGVAAIDEAVARVEVSRPYDVLLLDWKMPDLDGLATAVKLRARLENRTPPIVLLATAHSREELTRLPESACVDGILSKPLTGSSLYNAVMEARQRRGGFPAREEVAREKRLAGIRALVVDDNEVIRDLLMAILTDEGATVHLAENGEFAVKWLLSDPQAVDIVLLDVQMPVMDGYATSRIIRSSPALASLPIIALSAGVFRYEQEAALEAGMNDFVPKPFQLPDLVAAILRLTSPTPSNPSLLDKKRPPPGSDPSGDIDLSFGISQWKTQAVFFGKLGKFAAEYAGFVDDLAEHCGKGDSERVAFVLHRLKGTAGVLAMNPLATEAERLYRIVHEGGDPLPTLPALRLAMDRVLKRIAELVPPET
jgi:PAS domain S-box-containing protein